MNNFEKLKAANPEKYVEFTHEGVTFWVKEPRPAESQKKLKEFKVMKNVGDSGSIQFGVNESVPYTRWACIAMLHDKNEDGTFTRSFDDSKVEEAYEMLSNSFVTALNELAKTLKPKSGEDDEKNG